MDSATSRRSCIALLVATALVLSVDTANAVQRQAPVSPVAPVARAEVRPSPQVHPRGVAAHAKHVAHNASRRHRSRPIAVLVRREHPNQRRQLPAKRPHRTVTVTSPTGWAPLDAAIARIPTYRGGAAIWLVSNRYGHWGTADWYHDTLYVAPSVPTDRLYDVAVHEWSHELSVLDYGGSVDAAVAAMNSVFGGNGLVGAERAADCMARLQGASWTHYTPCLSHTWRAAAARLVAGKRL